MATQGWAIRAVEYIQQSLDDADVRKNLARAADASRQASRQLTGRRLATKAAKRTTLRRKLRDALLSLGGAGAAAREAERKRARSRRRRRVLLFVVGASIAIALSTPARGRAVELFGGPDDLPVDEAAPPP